MIASNFTETAPGVNIHIEDDSAPATHDDPKTTETPEKPAPSPEVPAEELKEAVEEVKEKLEVSDPKQEKIAQAYREKLQLARELRQQQQALKDAQQYREEALAFRRLREAAKRDSLAAVRELGIDEIELVNKWVQSDGSTEQKEERRVSDPRLDKVDMLEKEIQELRQERRAQTERELVQTELGRIGKAMSGLGEKAETLAALEQLGINVRQQILDRALQEYQTYGVEPSYEEIIETLEKESQPSYDRLLERFRQSKKYARHFGSVPQPLQKQTPEKPKYVHTGGVIDREARDLDDNEATDLMLRILKGEINPEQST